jgi:hypothetical protein
MSESFTKRLVRAARVTDMTCSDLARWFERPRATVNTWLNGRIPWGPQARRAERRLALLETSIKNRKKYYPVPADLSWRDREKYVRGMRDDAERHGRVSDVRATA